MLCVSRIVRLFLLWLKYRSIFLQVNGLKSLMIMENIIKLQFRVQLFFFLWPALVQKVLRLNRMREDLSHCSREETGKAVYRKCSMSQNHLVALLNYRHQPLPEVFHSVGLPTSSRVQLPKSKFQEQLGQGFISQLCRNQDMSYNCGQVGFNTPCVPVPSEHPLLSFIFCTLAARLDHVFAVHSEALSASHILCWSLST